ncbi:hypothetical protein CARUB_v10024246mg [Capsella rubella]|uniref:Bet v I/Major latex protein domain-containing protein n=1 Tax=Capsella rubella TaxID=81985 RepID=R0HRW8_9BRAS|nr:lachrymatory-factor synthase [Capsella rubella]EOA28065.1 hypothetical protein CARUB_v10024246mg [Capsella rubella]
MEEASRAEQWQGKVSVTLLKAKADQIWPLFTDFFNLNKWLPTIRTCYGIYGEPGCIRFCSGSGSGWSKEKLVAVDPVERVMRYEIVESNIGFESYVSTVKVSPRGEVGDVDGCVVEWSFTVDPVRGMSLDGLVKSYEEALGVITKNMEESLF